MTERYRGCSRGPHLPPSAPVLKGLEIRSSQSGSEAPTGVRQILEPRTQGPRWGPAFLGPHFSRWAPAPPAGPRCWPRPPGPGLTHDKHAGPKGHEDPGVEQR